MGRYALAVQMEEASLLFEVTDIIVTDFHPDPALVNRWNNGFLNGNVTFIKNNKIEKVSYGSYWDGNNLILNESEELIKRYNKENSILALSNNYVFGVLSLSENEYSRQKYEAALESNLIGIDVSNIQGVNIGSIWNGTEFIS